MSKAIQIMLLVLTISSSLAISLNDAHHQSGGSSPQNAPIYDPSEDYVTPGFNTNNNANNNLDYIMPTSAGPVNPQPNNNNAPIISNTSTNPNRTNSANNSSNK